MKFTDKAIPHHIVLAVYIACLAAGYFHVCFAGRSMIPSLFYPARGIGIVTEDNGAARPVNTFDVDLATPAFLEYPVNALAGSMIRSRTPPLWNPYQGCGVPLNAQYSTSVFFPYQALMNACPWRVWDHWMLGRLLFAGFFTYLFLISSGLGSAAAAIGGMMFMLSGSMVWFINLQQYINTAMVLPLLMFCAQKLVSCRQRRWRVWTAVSVALVLVAGQPEVAAYILLFCAAFVALRIFEERKERPHAAGARVALFAACCAAGAALAGCVILPFLEYTSHAFYCHPPGGSMGVVSPAPWNLFICILMPHLTEVPTFLRYFPHNGVWDYLGGYTGAGIMFLALVSLLLGRRRAMPIFFCVTAAVIIAKNAGCGLVSWIGRLPVLDQVWSNRWAGPVWVFACCCAAAFGAQAVSEADARSRRIASGAVAAALAAAIAVYAYHILFGYGGRIADFLSVIPDELLKLVPASFRFFDARAPYGGGALVSLLALAVMAFMTACSRQGKGLMQGLFILILTELWFCIPKAMDGVWTGYKAAVFCAGALSALLAASGRRKSAALALLAAAALMTGIDMSSPRGFPLRKDPFPETPGIRFLKERTKDHGRIFAADGVLMPNFAGAYSLQDIRYIDSMSPHLFQRYVNRHLLSAEHRALTQQLWFTGLADDFKDSSLTAAEEIMAHRAYYDLLGLAYFVSLRDVPADWPLVYDGEIKIYENPQRMPRAYIVHSIGFAPGPEAAQEAIGQPGFDARVRAVVEDPDIAMEPQRGKTVSSSALISEYGPDRVRIQTKSSERGILVLTDIHYPGWRAYVDASPARIFRVNGLVRGVLVEQGRHTVEFRYAPASFRLGIALGALGVIACAVLAFPKKEET